MVKGLAVGIAAAAEIRELDQNQRGGRRLVCLHSCQQLRWRTQPHQATSAHKGWRRRGRAAVACARLEVAPNCGEEEGALTLAMISAAMPTAESTTRSAPPGWPGSAGSRLLADVDSCMTGMLAFAAMMARARLQPAMGGRRSLSSDCLRLAAAPTAAVYCFFLLRSARRGACTALGLRVALSYGPECSTERERPQSQRGACHPCCHQITLEKRPAVRALKPCGSRPVLKRSTPFD